MRTRTETVFGVDFDGTCVFHEYPRIGKDAPHAVRVLRRIIESGHLIVLNTMRSSADDTLLPAVLWFQANGIELFGINNNPDQGDWTTSTKAYANIYIDDAALGCPVSNWLDARPVVDWLQVETMLEQKGLLT